MNRSHHYATLGRRAAALRDDVHEAAGGGDINAAPNDVQAIYLRLDEAAEMLDALANEANR